VPYVVEKWREENAGEAPEEGQIFTEKSFTGPAGKRKERRIYYQYRAARARRTLRGIDQQVEKAKNAIAGRAPVKRNRFLKVTGEERSLNDELVQKRGIWPGTRPTSPTCSPRSPRPSSSSAPITSCGRWRSRSG